MLVELSPNEAARANRRADAIQGLKKRNGCHNRVLHRDPDEVCREAMRAEAAFDKSFPGGERSEAPRLPDGSPDPHGNDGGYDFRFRNGLTVDVKSTTSPARWLLVNEWVWPLECDILVLAQVRGAAEVMLVGWCWAHEMEQHAQFRKLETGPAYALPFERLHAMGMLVRELR